MPPLRWLTRRYAASPALLRSRAVSREKTITLDDFATLRRDFVAAKDFGKFWNSFFDNWIECPEFIRMGQPVQSESVERLINEIGSRIFQRPVKAHGFMLLLVAEAKLIHGIFQLEQCTGNLLYFDDIDMGLVGVTHPGGRTDFARFTLSGPKQARPNA